jgi:hypothetical protein
MKKTKEKDKAVDLSGKGYDEHLYQSTAFFPAPNRKTLDAQPTSVREKVVLNMISRPGEPRVSLEGLTVGDLIEEILSIDDVAMRRNWGVQEEWKPGGPELYSSGISAYANWFEFTRWWRKLAGGMMLNGENGEAVIAANAYLTLYAIQIRANGYWDGFKKAITLVQSQLGPDDKPSQLGIKKLLKSLLRLVALKGEMKSLKEFRRRFSPKPLTKEKRQLYIAAWDFHRARRAEGKASMKRNIIDFCRRNRRPGTENSNRFYKAMHAYRNRHPKYFRP